VAWVHASSAESRITKNEVSPSKIKFPCLSFVGFETLFAIINYIIWGFSPLWNQNLLLHCCSFGITMPPPTKSLESEDWGTPTNNLWVGNLPPEVADSDLMELFAPYGSLDTLISYSPRTFAFLLFGRVEDAKAAKTNLQGALLRGFQIRIEFAVPVREN